jgi:hypothetical protein
MPKVGRVAEPQREGDVLHRHRRFPQVAQGDVGSEFVGQLTKRRILQMKLAPERTGRRIEELADGRD